MSGDRAELLERRAARWGTIASLLLVFLAFSKLFGQTFSFFGPFEPITFDLMRVMAVETTWGYGWMAQLASAVVAAGGFFWAWSGRRGVGTRGPRLAWRIATVAAFSSAATVPLTGHAVGESGWFSLTVLTQGAHVLGASLWLGTLSMLILVGVRGVADLSGEERGAATAAMVNAFSPMALAAAAVLGASGLVTSIVYLGSVANLWETTYGRVLMLKLAAVAAVVAFGRYNWQTVRPTLGPAGGGGRLLRSAGAELALAVAVLLVTAFFVGLPLPHD